MKLISESEIIFLLDNIKEALCSDEVPMELMECEALLTSLLEAEDLEVA